MYEVAIGYVVGTVVGLLLFRMAIRERIVTATLDMLIQEEYVKSWEDEDGTTQLIKWREAVDAESWRRLYEEIDTDKFEDILNEIMEEREVDEKDDTP